ncbi:MAG: D-Ala-D-Ala carboxypeptidase family metallohydrolase [Parabacteroides sp.]|nr:D-Ala-D-Ala carboxypeptidase family metallohydrolase [Parabacteroides sp.]
MKRVPNQTGTILLKGVPVTNDQAGFAHLWRQLAETRIRFEASYKRFCVRRILQDWFPAIATDDWIFEICLECEQGGYDELPDPAVDWLPHRYFLLALIKPLLNDLGDCDAIDMAYSEVFPDSKPIYLTSRRQRMSQKRLAKAAEMGGRTAGETNQEMEAAPLEERTEVIADGQMSAEQNQGTEAVSVEERPTIAADEQMSAEQNRGTEAAPVGERPAVKLNREVESVPTDEQPAVSADKRTTVEPNQEVEATKPTGEQRPEWLSEHFKLTEFERSDVARQLQIDNRVPAELIPSLRTLCREVLEPLRQHVGKPIRINSGYRCPALNGSEQVQGQTNSQHLKGEAADIHLDSVAEGRDWFKWLMDNTNVDQLIWERKGSTCWIHVSCKPRPEENRHHVKC